MAKVKKGKPSVRRYFMSLFRARPELLREPTNQAAIEQWEKDHPGKRCTANIKSNISNVKTYLRKEQGLGKMRRRKGKRSSMSRKTNGMVSQSMNRRLSANALEKLETAIDECLTQARLHDAGDLAKVVQHLRMARNTVVSKQGKFGPSY